MDQAKRASVEDISLKIINGGLLEVRDVDGGAVPFDYSSANRGPGYLMIKGGVGQPHLMQFLVRQLALKLVDERVDLNFDFIAANATGGMVPGWQLRNDLEELTGREVPYVYVRETRKIGGHQEYITGDQNNPLIRKGMRAVVHEELVNFAETTCNSATVLRDAGYVAKEAATILSYDNPRALEALAKAGINMHPLITLPVLLDLAAGTGKFNPKAVESYKEFLRDPVEWQLYRGLVVPEATAMKAREKGYNMRKLTYDEALARGAPEGKLEAGFTYWGVILDVGGG
jgi:orotate phosphoribosyltransferase